MDARWAPEDILEAVRRHLLSPRFDKADLIDRVELVGDDIQIVLRRVGEDLRPHAIRYSLSAQPYGANTGIESDSIEQWANEIRLDLDEVIITGELDRGERWVQPDGLVLVRWWSGPDWSR